MKLLTVEIRKKLPPLYTGEHTTPGEKVIIAKFFDPTGRGTWFAAEFDGTDTFFGFVRSPLGDDCDEWGYFSLAELQKVRCRFGLRIERDLIFTPTKFSEIR